MRCRYRVARVIPSNIWNNSGILGKAHSQDTTLSVEQERASPGVDFRPDAAGTVLNFPVLSIDDANPAVFDDFLDASLSVPLRILAPHQAYAGGMCYPLTSDSSAKEPAHDPDQNPGCVRVSPCI